MAHHEVVQVETHVGLLGFCFDDVLHLRVEFLPENRPIGIISAVSNHEDDLALLFGY